MPYQTIGDLRLAYTERGDGVALVFVHGLGSSMHDWSAQLDHFAPHYRAIALDLRGHGDSDKPAGRYSMRLFAADLAGLLEMIDAAPAHIVGLSLGGMVAFELAVNHPQLVRSLVIVNSAPAVVPRTLTQKWQFKKREWIVRFLGMRRMGRVLADRLLPDAQQKALHDGFVERWSANQPRAYLSALRAIVGWSVFDRIDTIDRPVLVVSADQDYTSPDQKRAWMQRLPNAHLEVIANSRHMTPLDQPAAFNHALDAFLDQTKLETTP